MLRIISILVIGALIIFCIFMYVYRPIYTVTLNGEFIGYSENKSKLQSEINKYMEQGEGEHIAFVQIDEMPEYEICLLKKDKVSNDSEILAQIKSSGVVYYEYFAITLDGEEKMYVSTYEEADAAVAELKKQKSTNADKLGVIKKYEQEVKEFTSSASIVEALFVKPTPVVQPVVYTSYQSDYQQSVNNTSTKVDLGISLIRPVSGTITSRFGYRSSGMHTGLDIANSTGTPIVAAADGVVKFSGTTSSGYGKYAVISHGNGIETYYCHTSILYVSEGQTVSQGQHIANVGSTGNSSGPHLHFEIRVDGQCQNPQNYVY